MGYTNYNTIHIRQFTIPTEFYNCLFWCSNNNFDVYLIQEIPIESACTHNKITLLQFSEFFIYVELLSFCRNLSKMLMMQEPQKLSFSLTADKCIHSH